MSGCAQQEKPVKFLFPLWCNKKYGHVSRKSKIYEAMEQKERILEISLIFLIVTIGRTVAQILWNDTLLDQENEIPFRSTIIFSFAGPKVPTMTIGFLFVPINLGQEIAFQKFFVVILVSGPIIIIISASFWRSI